MQVALASRCPGGFWSLEEIFCSVAQAFPAGVGVRQACAPRSGASLGSLAANMRWLGKIDEADLIHVTGDIHYAVLGARRRPVVLTIHDLRFYEEARGLRRWLFWWLWLYLPCKRANRVTVISQFTRERLLAAVKLSDRKVTVVPNCVSPRFVATPRPWPAGEARILHVGTTPNKNLERLAEACAGLKVRLCVLGRLGERQRQRLAELGIAFEEAHGLPQEKVAELYQNCDLVSFVSTYEGFGMPIIEGQAVGRPVLTSDLSPMREVAGNGALLVDPFSVESIRGGLQRLLNEPQLREQLVTAGFQNVSMYSPQAIAQRYLAVYEEVLERP